MDLREPATESLNAVSTRIASDLLRIGAVSFSPDEPYVWASGLHSPVYCDNRVTMGYPPIRRAIAGGFAACLANAGLEPDAIVGTATAGIAHAAWLAERMDLPMAYVRSKPKEHGRGNQIEGPLRPGQRVVVVEDLVSTGRSSVAVVEAVRAAGVTVEAVLAIFAYGLPGTEEAFEAAGVPLLTLTRFDVLLDVAREQGGLSPEAVASLQAWHTDPHGWSKRFE
jgi:orotate phosphoribosyltransferase